MSKDTLYNDPQTDLTHCALIFKCLDEIQQFEKELCKSTDSNKEPLEIVMKEKIEVFSQTKEFVTHMKPYKSTNDILNDGLKAALIKGDQQTVETILKYKINKRSYLKRLFF
jgi:hypothetical protein